MADASVTLTINKAERRMTVPAERLLRDFIRDDLGLTGTKAACDDGMCGACSVLVDGGVIKSCLAFAVEFDGCAITTIEGMASGNDLHPIQQALAEHFAIQCGFCTPGFVMTIAALLAAEPHPTEEAVRHAIAGNICRCTGYVRIVRAALDAADRLTATDPRSADAPAHEPVVGVAKA